MHPRDKGVDICPLHHSQGARAESLPRTSGVTPPAGWVIRPQTRGCLHAWWRCPGGGLKPERACRLARTIIAPLPKDRRICLRRHEKTPTLKWFSQLQEHISLTVRQVRKITASAMIRIRKSRTCWGLVADGVERKTESAGLRRMPQRRQIVGVGLGTTIQIRRKLSSNTKSSPPSKARFDDVYALAPIPVRTIVLLFQSIRITAAFGHLAVL